MAKKAKAAPKRRKIGERTETIAVRLTPMQIEDERAKVIELLQERDELDEKWKSTKADHKAKEAELHSRLETSRGMIRTGKVSREMTIEEYVDDRNEVIRVDKATGEEIGRRTATARELQEELPLPDPTPAAAPEAPKAPKEGEADEDDGDANLEREVEADADAGDDFGKE